MNCPSCNFKNLEENRFCIMCGTPIEGGGLGSDTTGSLDLSASLPGGADIDFSGLMDQVRGDGGGLFDDLDGGPGAGGKGKPDGGLDLMLSDFEGNLAALASGSKKPDKGAVPPPSGGEGWGSMAGSPSDDFSFSDLGALDPNRSEDVKLPGGAASQDPLDFSFGGGGAAGASGKGPGLSSGLSVSDSGGLDLGSPETGGVDDLFGPPGASGQAQRSILDLDGLQGFAEAATAPAPAPAAPAGRKPAPPPSRGPVKGDEDLSDDSMVELARFEGLAKPPQAGGGAGGGGDDLEDLLAEIEDLPSASSRGSTGKQAAVGGGGKAFDLGAETAGGEDGFEDLFSAPPAPAPAAKAGPPSGKAAAPKGGTRSQPKVPDLAESGLVFEEPPPGRPAPKPEPDQSVPGFDEFDELFESGKSDSPSASAPASGKKAAVTPKGGDDLDDFLAELEADSPAAKGSTRKGTRAPAAPLEELDLDGILPATPETEAERPAPAPARAGKPPARKAVASRPPPPESEDEEPVPVRAPARRSAAAPAGDASDDEIAALIGAMEIPAEGSEDESEVLDAGEVGPPTGSSLDDFLDELTVGAAPPTPSLLGRSQPLQSMPTALTPVPARLEEVSPKRLLEQLEATRDEDRRYQIVQRLAQLQSPETASAFLRLLDDANPDIRECAAEALGSLASPEAVKPLLKALASERGNLRYLCVEALGRIADRAATEPLIQLLRENDENMAYVVAEALGRIGDQKAVRPLMGLSGAADKDLRYIIAKSLGEIGSDEATPLLLQLLRDNDREVREAAIKALGEIEDPDGAGALLDFLDEDEDPELTLAAVRSLGRMKSRAAVRPLLGLLKTMREDLAVEVIHSLGKIGAPESVQPIITRLQDDPTYAVQVAGIRTLGELGDGSAVSALVGLLEGGREALKVPVAEALAKLKVPEALSPLEELLQDADVVVRKHAVEGIGALQDPASVSHLQRLVGDPDEAVRQAVARSLGSIGTEETLPLLLRLLEDADSGVSDAAIDGLESIGTPAVGSLVSALYEHQDEASLVVKVVRVLGSIGDIRGINPLLEVFDDAPRDTAVRIAEALVAIDRKLMDGGRISTLMKEGYAWIRYRIATALGRQDMPAAVELLLDILEETCTAEDAARLRNFPDAGIVLVNREALEGVRSAAASTLGELNLADTVKQVLARLVKAEGDTRLWLVRTLGHVQKEASITALIEILKREDSGIPAGFLGRVLRRIPLKVTVDRVLTAVATASATVRARCAHVLGILQDPRALGKLAELTRDADEEVRLSALGALEKIGSNQAFEALAKAVKDVSSAVRKRAVEALLTLPDDRSIPVLGTALQDRVAEVRGAAAKALGSIRDKRVVPILLAGLKDESSEVRHSIVGTLGKLGDRAAVKPLMQMLQDISSEVRQAAVRALGRIGDVEAVPSLLRSMHDHDLWVKTESRKTLLAMGDEALPVKVDCLGSEEEPIQQAAVAVLSESPSARLYALLLEAFGHRNKDMRANAARVLGILRETKAVVPLIHLLDDRDFEVREKAAVALGEIGDISASVALKHAQKDQNKDVRLAAQQALKRIMELAAVG